MADPVSIDRVIREIAPCEIYNEADQDDVGASYSSIGYSMDITAAAVGRLLEIVRKYDTSIKVFQPVSATMFGDSIAPQNEHTPFNPMSPYACAKVTAYYLARYYRQTYKMFVSTAILFNHDSPRRQGDYLLQRICRQAIEVSQRSRPAISLGNPDMDVDIGYARDYMEAAYQIMQLEKPNDFCIGSTTLNSVRNLAGEALRQVGLGDIPDTKHKVVADPTFNRPAKEVTLHGNCQKAYKTFGFDPRTGMRALINMILKNMQGIV
jgi:GDPmannose 4,6-dehydratase